ncbi:hypothetical protein J2Y55_005835 [Bosea sp. BE125]|uniref:hypothetical protein n=1 Tax=Bosea sp. BE125 TaxID=2817909 RepID=UPI002858C3E9|nr:hypothetical protein [Bosea sp. BE125]MDR6874797.1 hypothetical protein [Bosea sp. BE125]
MTDMTDTRDRVIALERDVKHLTEQVDDMADKVAAMHDILMQARGVRWIIVLMAGVGGFIASKLGAFIPWPR